MNRCILAILAIMTINSAIGQSSDFVQLKKRNKVLKTLYKDNDVYLHLKNGQWLTAVIYKIKDDSLYLRPYIVQTFINRIGLNYLDTTYYGLMPVHYNSIKAFPKDDESFSYIKNGTLLDIAGGGYMLLNIINTLRDDEPVFGSDNLPKLGIATGVLALGVVLGMTHKSNYTVGKKYHLEYISVKPSS